MYAITVKFLGATNTKGSRFKATSMSAPGGQYGKPAGAVTVPRNYSLNDKENAREVVRTWCERNGFTGFFSVAAIDDNHWVAVRVDTNEKLGVVLSE